MAQNALYIAGDVRGSPSPQAQLRSPELSAHKSGRGVSPGLIVVVPRNVYYLILVTLMPSERPESPRARCESLPATSRMAS